MLPFRSPIIFFASALAWIFLAEWILDSAAAQAHYDIEPFPEDLTDHVGVPETEFLNGDEEDGAVNIGDDDFLYVLRHLAVSRTSGLRENRRCTCMGDTCSCCLHIHLPKLHLDKHCCLNVSYLQQTSAFKLTFSIDGKVLIEKEIPAKDPLPVCIGIPGMHILARACVEISNATIQNKTINFCLKIEVKTVVATIFHFDLGCFHFPLRDEKEFEKLELFFKTFLRSLSTSKRYQDMRRRL